ncbi:MAG TPA: response regulator [Verrucomicrobiota bacterium]|nr:response regulator [Verrucomicrobiota bacterium]HQL78143.1 response regulator [Verrucomicrobiota bacterium]
MPNKNTQKQESRAGQPLVAVVDDDASFSRSLGRLLRSVGYTVNTFNSGHEFLDSLLDSQPACLVADMHMPAMSGLELAQRLRAQRRSVPVIFITAFDTPQTREQARRAGCFGFLLKPFDNDELLSAIRTATGTEIKAPGTGKRGEKCCH